MPKWLATALMAVLLTGCATPLAPATAPRKAAGPAAARAKLTGAGIFARLDVGGDGRLTLPEFRQLGIFGVNGRLFEPNPHPPLPEAQAATFASFDKDRDQAVSAAEFENFGVALQYALEFDSESEFYTTLFPTLDRDQDARLDPAEWAQLGYFGVYGVTGPTADPVASLRELLARSFAGLDRDRDGFLTVAELTFR